MSHTCHAHGCRTPVPPKMFMCRKHWFALRKPLQPAIWQEYRPGQESEKKPSLRYLAVQQWAIGEQCFKPNDEAAAGACAVYLMTAEVMRRRAIDAGQGDPLAGIAEYPPLSTDGAHIVAERMAAELRNPNRPIDPRAR